MKRSKLFIVLALCSVLVLGSISYCFADSVDANIENDSNGVKLVFTLNGKKYELRLNPYTGDVVNEGNNGTVNNSNSNISLEEAKEIALNDARVSTSTFNKAKLDYDDGRAIYEIEFIYGNSEYEYEIDANTGDILKRDIDIKDKSNSNKGSSSNSTTTITMTEAENIALKDAGVSRSSVVYINSQEDRDDGIYKIDVEFKQGNTEYEYEINSENGKILSKDIDIDD